MHVFACIRVGINFCILQFWILQILQFGFAISIARLSIPSFKKCALWYQIVPTLPTRLCEFFKSRGWSRTAATSKMEHFVIIVKELHPGWCSNPRSVSVKVCYCVSGKTFFKGICVLCFVCVWKKMVISSFQCDLLFHQAGCINYVQATVFQFSTFCISRLP